MCGSNVLIIGKCGYIDVKGKYKYRTHTMLRMGNNTAPNQGTANTF